MFGAAKGATCHSRDEGKPDRVVEGFRTRSERATTMILIFLRSLRYTFLQLRFYSLYNSRIELRPLPVFRRDRRIKF